MMIDIQAQSDLRQVSIDQVGVSDLRYPIVVKPNIGGSGAGITRFDSPAALEQAVEATLEGRPVLVDVRTAKARG